jgi:hypothetical protein
LFLTTDSNSLINLSKSSNILTLNYDNLKTKLDTYHTITQFNFAIASYYTKNQIDSTLGSYVNTVSNTTNDSLSLISLTKVGNALTFNYDNLASKFGGYYSSSEVDFKLGQNVSVVTERHRDQPNKRKSPNGHDQPEQPASKVNAEPRTLLACC